MRFRTVFTAGAIALAPALALADQPVMVRVNGQVIPVQQSTHIVQTSAGPARVSTWSWHSPDGHANVQMMSSTGGAPPEWALRQMQAMQSQMQLMQTQMRMAQAQIMQLQQAALTGGTVIPAPLPVMFATPAWAVTGGPVSVTEPAGGAARTPAPSAFPAAPAQGAQSAGVRL
ncbi:hypothetical protein [Paraburkholderia acidipaludis]|uniref:hypothetical protein n=1 Tax=Paraburkholderia acidipaludis TaxID=660537 RepID=UPI0004861947|nr:hypothetical protein [Paraburkholderia acidipaludis]